MKAVADLSGVPIGDTAKPADSRTYFESGRARNKFPRPIEDYRST